MGGRGQGGKTGTDASVQERRLRPIYELLDIGNNKKAVQEIDRILKKQSQFNCAKALKALALMRLGKVPECIEVLKNLGEEVPTDDATLQAMSVCYRELDQPEMICQILERACKVDKNEDLFTHAFMANVRVRDFQKQHQVAMMLYRLFPKHTYFCWAIMSLYIRAVTAKDKDQAAKVSLPLAERMMTKFIEELANNAVGEIEMRLYLLILIKQKNYEKVLNILESRFGKGLQLPKLAHHRIKFHCLKELGDLSKLADYLESLMVSSPDEWRHFTEYRDHIFPFDAKRAHKFLKTQLDQRYFEPTELKKTFLLELILLFMYGQDHGVEFEDSDVPLPYFFQYASYFIDRPSFYFEISIFFNTKHFQDLKDSYLQILDGFCHSYVPSQGGSTPSTRASQKHLNYFYTKRALELDQDKPGREIFSTFQKLVGHFMEVRHGEGVFPASCPEEEYLVLATLTLLDTFWIEQKQSKWKGIIEIIKSTDNDKTKADVSPQRLLAQKPSSSVENNGEDLNSDELLRSNLEGIEASVLDDMCSLKINESDNDGNRKCGPDGDAPVMTNCLENDQKPKQNSQETCKENGIIKEDNSFTVSNEDFPVFLALAAINHSVHQNPNHAQSRLILVKLLARVGAVEAMSVILSSFDLKHIQHESLAYLSLWKMSSHGLLRIAYRMFQNYEMFFNSYEKEAMEHIIQAYRYGSWENIIDFMEFLDGFRRSLQAANVKVERRLLEFLKDGTNTSRLIQLATHSMFDFQSSCMDQWDSFKDNRDFAIIETYVWDKHPEWKKDSFQADKVKLKIRGAILELINIYLRMMDDGDEAVTLSKAETPMAFLKKESETDHSVIEKALEHVDVSGVWKPRIFHLLSTGQIKLLIKFFALIHQYLSDPSGVDLNSSLAKINSEVKAIVDAQIQEWKVVSKDLVHASEILESHCDLIETLSFLTILGDILGFVIKKKSTTTTSGGSGKGKKKKDKMAFVDPVVTKPFNEFLDLLTQTFKEVHKEGCWALQEVQTNSFGTTGYPRSSAMISFWRSMVSEDVFHVVAESLPEMLKLIQTSYEHSLLDISESVVNRLEYIESLRFPVPNPNPSTT